MQLGETATPAVKQRLGSCAGKRQGKVEVKVDLPVTFLGVSVSWLSQEDCFRLQVCVVETSHLGVQGAQCHSPLNLSKVDSQALLPGTQDQHTPAPAPPPSCPSQSLFFIPLKTSPSPLLTKIQYLFFSIVYKAITLSSCLLVRQDLTFV